MIMNNSYDISDLVSKLNQDSEKEHPVCRLPFAVLETPLSKPDLSHDQHAITLFLLGWNH